MVCGRGPAVKQMPTVLLPPTVRSMGTAVLRPKIVEAIARVAFISSAWTVLTVRPERNVSPRPAMQSPACRSMGYAVGSLVFLLIFPTATTIATAIQALTVSLSAAVRAVLMMAVIVLRLPTVWDYVGTRRRCAFPTRIALRVFVPHRWSFLHGTIAQEENVLSVRGNLITALIPSSMLFPTPTASSLLQSSDL